MTARTVSNLPAAMHVETARCLFAIELSKQSWVIGFITPLSAKISRRILSGGDWKGLLELIEEVRARVSRETGRAVDVISCYEAGYDGFWLHRLLEAHGIRNYVIDPASLQVDRRMRRVKTDRIDTERLLRSLMAYLRGEPKVWSVVRVPSIAEEDARRLHRERDRLVTVLSCDWSADADKRAPIATSGRISRSASSGNSSVSPNRANSARAAIRPY